MRWFLFAVLVAFAGLLLVQQTGADPVSASSLNVLSTGTRTLPSVSNGTIMAQGGNVTEVNIDSLTITKAWQGYFGNVTGNIHLDDANNNSFYVWGNATSLSGEVYASRNSSPSWTTINCTNATQRGLEETYLGQTVGDGDSVTNTFNRTLHPTFYVGPRQITNNSCYSTNVFVNGSSQNSTFYQIMLSDQWNTTVYTTILESDVYGYNARRMDFQLMVGENEHFGSEGPTAYYFFTELS
jgi:hypothetical protein